MFDLSNKGLIHIYCGDGKGKTTAALGLSIRAAGAGMKVVLVQFLKNQRTSELEILEKLPGYVIIRGKEGPSFSYSMTEEEKEKSTLMHTDNLRRAIDLVNNGGCHLLILDEIIGAWNKGLVDQELLKGFIENKPEELELVLTGRNPEPWMRERADYISEIKKVKHPYDSGVKSRKGIEK